MAHNTSTYPITSVDPHTVVFVGFLREEYLPAMNNTGPPALCAVAVPDEKLKINEFGSNCFISLLVVVIPPYFEPRILCLRKFVKLHNDFLSNIKNLTNNLPGRMH